MVGRGYGRKSIGRLIGASAIALAVMLVAPLASASAAAPSLAIASPSEGSAIASSTPTIAGTTNYEGAGVTVEIYAAGEPLVPVQTLPSPSTGGGWSVAASFLSDGSYTAVAEQTNAETSERGAAQVSFTVDTTKPSVSLNAITTPTNDSTPTFGGSGGTASGDASTVTVTVYSGSSTSGSVVAVGTPSLSGSTWSFTPAALADGTYTTQATQSDDAGNVGQSTARTFTVDTTAPSVSLNTIGTPTNNTTPTFTGTGGTASGDATTVTVTVYSGSSTSGSVVTSGTPSLSGSAWSWAVASGRLKDASTYTVQVSQRDQAGNVGESVARTFSVDTTAPSVSLNAIGTPTNNATPTFSGTGGTASGDATTVTVTVYSGSSTSGSVETSGTPSIGGGGWSYSSAHLNDGTYTAQATQSDQAGNVGKSVAHTFTIDTVKPAVTLTPLAEVVASTKPTLSGSTSDVTPITVAVYDGTAATGSPVETIKVTPSAGSWSTTAATALADGTYTAVAEQTDDAGNRGVSEPSTFTVKTKGPAVSLNSVPTWTNDPTPSFSGGVGTAEHDLPTVTLEFFERTEELGSTAIRKAEATDSGGTWTVGPVEALRDGTYTAEAKQFDQAKNEGVSIARTFTVDTVRPVLTLGGPEQSNGLEMLSGEAGDAPGDRQAITVELFAGSAVGEPGQAFETLMINRTAGSWSATFASLPVGEYAVIARQFDEAGNAGQSNAANFTVTTPSTPPPSTPPAPSPPSASFTWVPATPSVGQSVSLVSSSTDPSSAIGSFAWDVAGNGQFALGPPAMTTSFASAGSHAVSLRVSDGNGLSSTATETIKVLAAAPKLMQPFPIVRIAGSETSYGVKVRLLTVQAPLGAKVSIACVGGGCKTKAESRVAKASSKSTSRAGAVTLAFARFERPLRAGASLQIRVTQAGDIGKYTSFAIRRKRLPVRTDACLQPASSKPSACPSS
ncbi:MAG TPA: Ig-like domain-containing protein [Solirubrobacteraceae bacterium]|jgi:major membrane immunogen (membrane-anchored lipoprotein)|nr:Ig-like domain-containing protein [Solirubrobacteraceae bacterium]